LPDSRGRDGAPRRSARPGAPGYGEQARPAVAAPVASRGRHDTGPSRRYPDFLPADHPSGPLAGYDAPDEPRDRKESRRKAAPVAAAGKSRSRQRGRRDHDGDWPSTEWDTLSDEQYWAELSADKPLSNMARPAKPAGDRAAMAPAKGSTMAKSPARAARLGPGRGLPSRNRKEREDQGGPATERLPVRTAARARQAQVPPAPLPSARRDADLATAGPSRPDPRALLDTGPRFSRDTGPYGIRDTGPLRDTGPQPTAGHWRRDSNQAHAARDQDLAIPGALEDDPLTSPSFSLRAIPATDTRSYGNARKHAKATGPAVGAAHAHGNGSGSYPAADYADPGYAYQAAPPVPVPPPAPPADRYSAPPAPAAGAQTPAYGNPYNSAGGGSGGSSGGFPGSHATADYPNYLADPLRVYSPPKYEAQARYPEATSPDPYQAVPTPLAAGTAPYGDGYAGHPYADQARYLNGYRSDAPVPGDEQQGYRADPYAAGGYGPYPPQG
jgi:hypothetical protein